MKKFIDKALAKEGAEPVDKAFEDIWDEVNKEN